MKLLISQHGVWIAIAGMLGVALVAIALAVTMPIPEAVEDGVASHSHASEAAVGSRARVSLEQWQHDFARELQRPLVDVPADSGDAHVAAPVAALPPLVGTIVESGQSVALLDMPGVGISFKHIGDSVADSKIVAIDVTGITVIRQGRSAFIRVSQPLPAAAILRAKGPILGAGT